MMKGTLPTAFDRYHARAEECRVIARGMSDHGCRQTMFGIADDYVAMAEQARRMSLIEGGVHGKEA